MPKYSLTQRNASYLTLEIGGKEYNIPLAASLKFKDVKKLLKIEKLDQVEQLETMSEFFASYLGSKVVDEMTFSDLTEVMVLWNKANQEAGGPSLGES